MRVLFYGTPRFALPTLEALRAVHEVVGVVTQPDRPAGRGQRVAFSAVKEAAAAAGIPVLQPDRLRDARWLGPLQSLLAEVAVVVAYGQILPRAVLDVPQRGSINVHASLLPKYRGAAPIAWALIRGEVETGVTTFQMDEGMDTGPILLAERTPIRPGETAGEVAERLSTIGARVLIQTLAQLDTLSPRPQPDTGATLAPRLRKADGELDWRDPALAIVGRIRGCNPWPGAATQAPHARLVIWRAQVTEAAGEGSPPGTLVAGAAGLVVSAGQGAVEPLLVQPPSRRAVSWPDYVRGARLHAGDRLGGR
jgi:methionyl-tRNA formyltransferase